MCITQTVEIPESRRLVLDVPREVPAGQVLLTFTPAIPEQGVSSLKRKSPRIGFLKGQISVPDDFDTMGQEEILEMFGIAP